jgi:hypothetical protein
MVAVHFSKTYFEIYLLLKNILKNFLSTENSKPHIIFLGSATVPIMQKAATDAADAR